MALVPSTAPRTTFANARSIVVVAESPPERLWDWRRHRGRKMLNVFHRDGDQIHHFWGTELAHGPADPGQHHRGLEDVLLTSTRRR